ncbi:GYD domain-containing protein [Noviherbaspirillum denitrificans]|uniref:GYD family protein n=1 Tax=Noviherbaspirillum denitrificans TaxID=1968433 RepID=A0A254TB27_9BURK|nr:GYD domain-containing protein [Noviherbaspirillum denitrificans]OWW19856.1 GYD family protein [Noviherbaspirillum denitrificans]
MATYIALISFTDQGIRTIKDTVKRADMVREGAGKFGVKVKEMSWTQGQYDMVVTFEAQDEAAFTAFGLAVSSTGNVRSQTMRAFTRDEMAAILAKIP